ncbi:MAG: hypothetical protein LBH50_04370 [Spirochaetaceae bacterium]|jgi:hypothetical protein|nr:hypothetical protein [Spirochaetaceae bacterium]
MTDLLQTMPPVERARGFRLYCGGKRLTDLWQCGGRALLGHKPANVVKCMKNAAERGLFAPFPNKARRRFTKALERLFPETAVKVYADWSLVPDYQKIPLWRPFCGDFTRELTEKKGAFRPILPFPLAPAVIVCEKSREKDFPPEEYVSPVLLACVERAVYDLLACPERGIMGFGRIKKAFERENVKKSWRLHGIYIHTARGSEYWEDTFRRFLDGGFLVPPDTSEPLIIPGELSNGEEGALARLLDE